MPYETFKGAQSIHTGGGIRVVIQHKQFKKLVRIVVSNTSYNYPNAKLLEKLFGHGLLKSWVLVTDDMSSGTKIFNVSIHNSFTYNSSWFLRVMLLNASQRR